MQRPQKFAKQDDPDLKLKGKHKGKGKGKNDAGETSYLPGTKLELLTHTPDCKQICYRYRYNMQGKKCDGRCGRVHICRVKGCGASHAAFEHPTTNRFSIEPGDIEFKPQDEQIKAPSSNAEKPTSNVSEVPCLKIVYVCAGHRRRADVPEHLERLALASGFTLDMHELQDEMWANPKEFRNLKPFCVIATPPCSSYSRARHFYKVSPGPRPIRRRDYPLGLPWLSQSDKRKADEGTLLATRAWELYFLAHDIGALILENFQNT